MTGTTYWQGKVTSKTRKGENMAERRSIRFVAFIVRCAAAATCAYGAAILAGLPHPVWAAISALVVSQERLGETGASLLWRIAGTLIGLCVAVAVSVSVSGLRIGTAAELAIAAGICAAIARQYPAVRVCMWTAAIALLTGEPGVPIIAVAAYRGTEVILGALAGGALHAASEIMVRAMEHGFSPPPAAGPA